MIRALIIGILGAAVAACSTTPSHPAARTASAIPQGWCTTANGSTLPPGSSGCNALHRTYSGEQLRQTGATDVAHALELLDPDVTIHGIH